MALFEHKKDKQQPVASWGTAAEQAFFDENFREELRNHGRWYFEKVITENAALFKADLDTTIVQVREDLRGQISKQLEVVINDVNAELKDHVSKQLNDQFVEYSKAMSTAQNAALQALNTSAQALTSQYQKLAGMLEKGITDQEAILNKSFADNEARIAAMSTAQDTALKSLEDSAAALRTQYEQISGTLQKNVSDQEAMLLNTFEDRMASVIEHYLLDAVGDQYDLKAQLPAIIKQMEANKDAIVGDMSL